MGTDWYLVAAITLLVIALLFTAAVTFHALRDIAAHESGHAVFYWISPASGGVEKVIAGAFSGAAHVFDGHYRPRRVELLLDIMGNLSGYAGDAVLHGSCRPSKSDTDLERALAGAKKAARQYPELRDDLARAASDAPASVWRARQVFAASASTPEVAALMTVLLATCVRLLEKNRPGLEAVNRSLFWRRYLSADHLRAILGRRPTRDEFWRQFHDEPSL